MKAIYKPFGLVVGLLGGMVGKRIFTLVWGAIDDEDPPRAKTKDASWAKVLGAAAIQGTVFTVIRVAITRAGAKGYEHLTGVWPGEKKPEPA